MRPLPRFSHHAEERWSYRCAGLDRQAEWERCRALSAKRKARLLHHSGWQSRHAPGTEYLLSPAGVIFVVVGLVVVTVFTLEYTRARAAIIGGH